MFSFSFKRQPPKQPSKKWCDCEQPDYHIYGSDLINECSCRKCGRTRNMYELINNLIDRVNKLEKNLSP